MKKEDFEYGKQVQVIRDLTFRGWLVTGPGKRRCRTDKKLVIGQIVTMIGRPLSPVNPHLRVRDAKGFKFDVNAADLELLKPEGKEENETDH